jgi:hypothetical protein
MDLDVLDFVGFDVAILVCYVYHVGFLTVVIFFHGQSISQNRRNKKIFLLLSSKYIFIYYLTPPPNSQKFSLGLRSKAAGGGIYQSVNDVWTNRERKCYSTPPPISSATDEQKNSHK